MEEAIGKFERSPDKKVSFKINNDEESFKLKNDAGNPQINFTSSSKQQQDNKKNKRKLRFKIVFYMILLFIHTGLIYFVKPICTLLEIVFLTKIIKVSTDSNVPVNSAALKTVINNGLLVVGWLLILLLPLVNFFMIGLKIIAVHDSFFGRMLAVILLLIETILNVPLTFLYPNNIYSIFLFQERGIEQLINPWLIFFPTVYTKSIFEIIRNFIEPGFFFAIGFIKYNDIKNNAYEEYLVILLQMMLVLCILKIVGNIVTLIMKIRENRKKKWNFKGNKAN